jgi:hypothetical protein
MVDEDFRRQLAGEQIGSAIKFTDIDGIGPATAQKIKNADYNIQAPKDIQDMSADELADKAGISRSRARKAIEGAGGNPNVSNRNTTGSVSAAGARTRQGDFWVEFSEMDKARARNDARSRSEQAVQVDERRRAPVTTDYDKWKDNPGRWDFPGVDTPTQDPNLRPKDLRAGNPDTAEFDEKGRAEYDDDADPSYPQKRDAASGKENFILQTEGSRIPASEFTDGPEGEQIRDRRQAQQYIAAADVSASSEEIFKGTMVGSVSEFPGGPTWSSEGVRETDRVDKEHKPPENALRRQQRKEGKGIKSGDTKGSEIAFIYENTDVDMPLSKFGRRVRREMRHMGLQDPFGVAQMVAHEEQDS